MLLDCVCCTRSIQTQIIVCSVRFHPLLPDLDILQLQSQLIHWSLKYQFVKHHNLTSVSQQHKFVCAMTFPSLCLTLEYWMVYGSSQQLVAVGKTIVFSPLGPVLLVLSDSEEWSELPMGATTATHTSNQEVTCSTMCMGGAFKQLISTRHSCEVKGYNTVVLNCH